LPSGFVPVPVPCTWATPTNPLKSPIDDGSTPGPKNVTWKSVPFRFIVFAVGFGDGFDFGAANAPVGRKNVAPTATPAAPAARPINARRDSPWVTWCDDMSDRLEIAGAASIRGTRIQPTSPRSRPKPTTHRDGRRDCPKRQPTTSAR